jgi:hypothetical protein
MQTGELTKKEYPKKKYQKSRTVSPVQKTSSVALRRKQPICSLGVVYFFLSLYHCKQHLLDAAQNYDTETAQICNLIALRLLQEPHPLINFEIAASRPMRRQDVERYLTPSLFRANLF